MTSPLVAVGLLCSGGPRSSGALDSDGWLAQAGFKFVAGVLEMLARDRGRSISQTLPPFPIPIVILTVVIPRVSSSV